MKLAVAGGTGIVGEHVVRFAAQAGHDVVVLARSAGVDLVAGTGLDLTGVDAVIDVSGPNTISTRRATNFFTRVTRNLLQAEAQAGVRHHIALSIVGVPESPYGYYAGKAAQERILANAPIPTTILRATQFFEFAEQKSMTLGRVSFTPRLLAQPVAAASVARRLVELAEAGHGAGTVDFAGPSRIRMAELLRAITEARGENQAIIEFPLPGPLGRAFTSGALLPKDGAEIDGMTFGEWIAERSRG